MSSISYRSKLLVILLLALAGPLHAATLYVTDRILLGVHQEPSEESALIRSIPSGEKVETVQVNGAFTRVRLSDGTQGWVTTSFLKPDRPATHELDDLYPKYQKNLESMRTMEEQLAKSERNVQILRDELSNAKTTIKELNKGTAQKSGNEASVDAETEKKLDAATKQVDELTKQNQTLQTELTKIKSINQGDLAQTLQNAEKENVNLKVRIEAALANLKGERVPTPEELAAIRPHFPIWFWGLVLIVVLLGIFAGATWMDIQHRRRHGGFRL